jgi:DNA-binding MarR family transcriptional regulator
VEGVAEAPDEPLLAAWRAFIRAHARVVDRLDHELQSEQDLPLTWYEVLFHLERSPDHRLRLSDLASRLLLSRSGITRLVDRMVAAGAIERQACPTDRRGAFAALTPDGLTRLRRARPVHLRGIQEHFASHLRPEEVEPVRAALERVFAAAQEPSSPT